MTGAEIDNNNNNKRTEKSSHSRSASQQSHSWGQVNTFSLPSTSSSDNGAVITDSDAQGPSTSNQKGVFTSKYVQPLKYYYNTCIASIKNLFAGSRGKKTSTSSPQAKNEDIVIEEGSSDDRDLQPANDLLPLISGTQRTSKKPSALLASSEDINIDSQACVEIKDVIAQNKEEKLKTVHGKSLNYSQDGAPRKPNNVDIAAPLSAQNTSSGIAIDPLLSSSRVQTSSKKRSALLASSEDDDIDSQLCMGIINIIVKNKEKKLKTKYGRSPPPSPYRPRRSFSPKTQHSSASSSTDPDKVVLVYPFHSTNSAILTSNDISRLVDKRCLNDLIMDADQSVILEQLNLYITHCIIHADILKT